MDYQNNNFISNKFHWFTGVVEDIYDPYEMGRIKVRCFGYHTDNKDRESGIPTHKLPWAHVMMPITSASCSGIGESATGVVQGSWVVGFFRDGEACQDPLVMGTIPSRTPRSKIKGDVGFRDPFGENPKNDNDIDNPRQSRTDFVDTDSYRERNASVDETKYTDKNGEEVGVPTAQPPTTDTLKNVLKKDDTFFEVKRWIHKKQKEICHPTYPHNHVKSYDCGHVVEFDETPTRERIVIQHKAGTFDQIDASGDKTTVIQGNNYQVIVKDQHVNIKGFCNLTIDKDVRTLVKGDYYLEVEKDYHLLIHGNKHEKIVMSDFLEVGKNQQIKIGNNRLDSVDHSAKYVVSCQHTLDSPRAIDYELHVKRNLNEKINGSGKRFVGKNYKQEIIGTLTELSNTKIDTVNGNYKIEVNPDGNEAPDDVGFLDIDSVGNITMTTPANVDIDGARIDLN